MTCGKDPFWVCEDDLTCLGGTCAQVIREAKSCNAPGAACAAPLSCVGNLGNKKCFMKKGLGMTCGKDPFWVCEDGLTCLDGTCVRAAREAGVCDGPNEVCLPPLSCVGPVGVKRCFMKKGLGMRCGKDPFWVCEDGLTCLDGTCVKAAREAGVCDGPNEVCLPPLSCVGPVGVKRCFMKKGLGMTCGQDPFWVCEDGLVCFKGKCRTSVARAGSCSDPDAGCVKPFICAGPAGGEKCVKRKYRGMVCGDTPFSKCAPRLKCDTDGICKLEMGLRGKCGANFQICTPPLSCVGTPELKRCVMKKGIGMVCGKDPFWVCEDGLECINSRCVK